MWTNTNKFVYNENSSEYQTSTRVCFFMVVVKWDRNIKVERKIYAAGWFHSQAMLLFPFSASSCSKMNTTQLQHANWLRFPLVRRSISSSWMSGSSVWRRKRVFSSFISFYENFLSQWKCNPDVERIALPVGRELNITLSIFICAPLPINALV